MVHRISDILTRFPESEQAVRQLIQQSPEFAALCQEYENTSRELGHFTTMAETTEVDELRKRSTALEEEILTKIEGYQPA
jgi:uncharacterized protein YdcH (DUF465 family)